ncbi:hypothetical protein Poly59_61250 [Rubripirellula reticaptiva]|uniref:Uncharacterized protein n=1 Tax=Rubripirellula reticaptiva TaxID=2528013 RepID=A0A5C6E6J4_9BACT|nr:hypothetical protein Poly59_61250 [Rubripirellula reticaptiva]
MPVYLPTRSTPNCLPREPTLAKLWRRGNDCPMLDQRPFINADNQHMHRSGGGHVSLKSRQSPPPGDVKRYPTDSLRCPAYFFAQAIASTFDCELVVRLLR